MGWDGENRAGHAQQYNDVVHEDALKVGLDARAPDYFFRIGGVRKFFVEAKKPAINLKDDPELAFQLRRYAWSAKLPLSVLTDFKSSFPQFALFSSASAPMCLPDKPSEGERFVTAVRGMMSLQVAKRAMRTPEEDARLQREIEARSSIIDRLVYDLHGLTDEEIALVEHSVPPA